MRYTIKDKFGNVYKFGKNELIEAAKSGKIEPNAIVFDGKSGRSATAENVPELQDAFEYYEEKKEAQAREKELAKNEKAREKAEKEAQKEEAERKRREDEEAARQKAQEEAERRRAQELEKLEAEERTLAERYGSVEIAKEIQKTKKVACAKFGILFELESFVAAFVLFWVGYGVGFLLTDSAETLAAELRGTQFGYIGLAIGLPGFWLSRYSQLTAKRQAATIRLNELYDESKRLRENRDKNAA